MTHEDRKSREGSKKESPESMSKERRKPARPDPSTEGSRSDTEGKRIWGRQYGLRGENTSTWSMWLGVKPERIEAAVQGSCQGRFAKSTSSTKIYDRPVS